MHFSIWQCTSSLILLFSWGLSSLVSSTYQTGLLRKKKIFKRTIDCALPTIIFPLHLGDANIASLWRITKTVALALTHSASPFHGQSWHLCLGAQVIHFLPFRVVLPHHLGFTLTWRRSCRSVISNNERGSYFLWVSLTNNAQGQERYFLQDLAISQ